MIKERNVLMMEHISIDLKSLGEVAITSIVEHTEWTDNTSTGVRL